ncbi:MAG TPA: pyridoxamine 5'-phosphate oxidase family protein [Pseudonocardiaceae bacterium]|nr:pyridoxamine 5'-phosphate oxidase family protein [Pseudonocardiaceae bacterium]
MAEREPLSAVNCTDQWNDNAMQPADPGAVLDWEQARERLAAARLFWVATVRAGGGAPHVRPVFAVWIDGRLYSTTNGTRAKARNLAADPHVAITTSTDEIDFIVEGTAAPVTDEAELAQVVDAYGAKYGWPLSVRDGALHAPFAAPAAGPPPYRPYAVTPEVIFGMGTNDALAPRSTRWRF